MSRLIQGCASLLFGLCLLSGEAEAKRGVIPIPCTGDKIVKVADLPALKHNDGTKIDLGYRYSGCFSGEWVGYVGSSDRYLKLNPEMVPLLAASSGLGPAPSEPGFLSGAVGNPLQFWAEWLWILVIGCIALAAMAKRAPAQAGMIPAAGPEHTHAYASNAVAPSPEPATSAASAAPQRAPRMRDAAASNAPLRQSQGFGRRVR